MSMRSEWLALAAVVLLLNGAAAFAQQAPQPAPPKPAASEAKPPATQAPPPRPFRPSEDVSSGRKVSFPNDI